MFRITDSMVAEEHRKDLLRKFEQRQLQHEAWTGSQGRTRYRPILAKIGTRLVQWGAYLEAHYGESEPQIKLRA